MDIKLQTRQINRIFKTKRRCVELHKPILNNISTKFGNNRWKTKSLKLQRNINLFSDLEYENWFFIEFNLSSEYPINSGEYEKGFRLKTLPQIF